MNLEVEIPYEKNLFCAFCGAKGLKFFSAELRDGHVEVVYYCPNEVEGYICDFKNVIERIN